MKIELVYIQEIDMGDGQFSTTIIETIEEESIGYASVTAETYQ